MRTLVPADWKNACYVVLGVHCCLAGINGFQWANYSPVPDEAKAGLGITHSNINTLLLVYSVIWAPCMPLSIPLQNATGPYGPLIVGAALNALASVLKIVAGYCAPGFALTVTAQTFAGAAEVFFLPLPPLIASAWFPTTRRTMCTALGSLSNSVGIAIGYAVTPRIVQGAKTDLEGFQQIYLGQAAFSLVVLAVVLSLPRAPAHRPSSTAAAQLSIREIPPALKELGRNRNYLLFVATSGVAVSIGWMSAGMLPQVLKPFGVTEDNAGLMGSLFTICGAAGQFLTGHVGDKTRRYLEVIIACYAVTLFMLVAVPIFVMGAGLNATVIGYIAVPTLGVAFVGSLPPMYELLVELTYPVPVAVAVGVQMLLSRIVCSPVINRLGNFLITNKPDQHDAFVFNVTYGALFALSLASLLFVKRDYRRLAADKDVATRGDDEFADEAAINEVGEVTGRMASSRRSAADLPDVLDSDAPLLAQSAGASGSVAMKTASDTG